MKESQLGSDCKWQMTSNDNILAIKVIFAQNVGHIYGSLIPKTMQCFRQKIFRFQK